jgi:hypothetical protein
LICSLALSTASLAFFGSILSLYSDALSATSDILQPPWQPKASIKVTISVTIFDIREGQYIKSPCQSFTSIDLHS